MIKNEMKKTWVKIAGKGKNKYSNETIFKNEDKFNELIYSFFDHVTYKNLPHSSALLADIIVGYDKIGEVEIGSRFQLVLETIIYAAMLESAERFMYSVHKRFKVPLEKKLYISFDDIWERREVKMAKKKGAKAPKMPMGGKCGK